LRRIKVVAALVLLFGCTFVWVMPSYRGLDRMPTGGPWSVVQLQVVLTAPLFTAAGWAVDKSLPRWRMPAITGSVPAAAMPLRWWVAVISLSAVTDPAANIAVRPAGSPATLAALLLPGISREVDRGLDVRAAMNVGGR
jgi:hypothetical protein